MPQPSEPFRSASGAQGVRFVRLSSLSPLTRQRLVTASSREDLVLLRRIPWHAQLPWRWAAAALAAASPMAPRLWGQDPLTSSHGPLHPLWRFDPLERFSAGAALSLALFALFLLARRWREARALGFAPGTYLFARDLVVASGDGLLIAPTDELERVVVRGRRLLFSFKKGEQFSLPHRGEDPLELEAQIQAARAEAERWEGTDAAEQYDPLDADRGLPGEGVAPARRSAVALSLGALACLALGVAASLLVLPRVDLWRERRALMDSSSASIFFLEGYINEARSRGDEARLAMADQAWLDALRRWNGKGPLAPGVLGYLKAGGRERAAALGLLSQGWVRDADDATYAALFEEIGSRDDEASVLLEILRSEDPALGISLREGRYGEFHWLGLHGKRCEPHRREYFSRLIEGAARPQRLDLGLLRVIAGERDRGAGGEFLAPELFLDDVPAESKARAAAALDKIFAQAEDALRGSELAAPVQGGFIELVKQARKGKPSAVFLGAIDPDKKASIPLGQMLRNSGGPLCNELFEKILPPIVKAALFTGFKAEYVHHQQECLVAARDAASASVVLRCSSKNHPAEDTSEFLLDRCELTFPGAPSAAPASATFGPPLSYKHWGAWRYPEFMLTNPKAFSPGPDFTRRDQEELDASKVEYLRTLAVSGQLWRALGKR